MNQVCSNKDTFEEREDDRIADRDCWLHVADCLPDIWMLFSAISTEIPWFEKLTNGRMDGWMDRWTDGNSPLCSTGHCSLWVHCPDLSPHDQ